MGHGGPNHGLSNAIFKCHVCVMQQYPAPTELSLLIIIWVKSWCAPAHSHTCIHTRTRTRTRTRPRTRTRTHAHTHTHTHTHTVVRASCAVSTNVSAVRSVAALCETGLSVVSWVRSAAHKS